MSKSTNYQLRQIITRDHIKITSLEEDWEEEEYGQITRQYILSKLIIKKCAR